MLFWARLEIILFNVTNKGYPNPNVCLSIFLRDQPEVSFVANLINVDVLFVLSTQIKLQNTKVQKKNTYQPHPYERRETTCRHWSFIFGLYFVVCSMNEKEFCQTNKLLKSIFVITIYLMHRTFIYSPKHEENANATTNTTTT